MNAQELSILEFEPLALICADHPMGYHSPVKEPQRPMLVRALVGVVNALRRYVPWLVDGLGPIKRAVSSRFYAWVERKDRLATARMNAARAQRLYDATGMTGDPKDLPIFGTGGIVNAVLRVRSLVAGTGVLHCIGALGSGGAERQLCLLMSGARSAGIKTTLLTLRPLSGNDGHFLQQARRSADRCIHIAKARWIRRFGAKDSCIASLCDLLPDCYEADIAVVAAICKRERPAVVHTWLDPNNVAGGLGAVLAGVPRVVLGLRNVSPRHFPHLLLPQMRELYGELARFEDRVKFVANTIEGARDYAEWIGIPVERIGVVSNAVDVDALESDVRSRSEIRCAIGVPADAPVVLGVFRLSDEKRPLAWIEVVERVLQQIPTAHAVHAGVGSMQQEFRERMERSPHRARIHLLGRRDDAQAIMAAAEVIVLASRAEGMPNVLLEAQALGCVPVATAVGGAPEVVDSGVTGELRTVDDLSGIADAVIALLHDPGRRAAMVEAGRARVRERFSVDALVAGTRRYWAL